MRGSNLDLMGFLTSYPRISIEPSTGANKILKGMFEFVAEAGNAEAINDSYMIRIEIPPSFPNAIPVVRELNGRIPKSGDFHVNDDGTLCLGSPLRLRFILSKYSSLVGFAEKCLIPYFYSVSLKLKNKGPFALGELPHGKPGVVRDYMDLFGVKSEWQVKSTISYLGLKKRIANKKLCPCQCGRRLGKCIYHNKLNEFRLLAPRSWFKAHLTNLGGSSN